MVAERRRWALGDVRRSVDVVGDAPAVRMFERSINEEAVTAYMYLGIADLMGWAGKEADAEAAYIKLGVAARFGDPEGTVAFEEMRANLNPASFRVMDPKVDAEVVEINRRWAIYRRDKDAKKREAESATP